MINRCEKWDVGSEILVEIDNSRFLHQWSITDYYMERNEMVIKHGKEKHI